MPTFRALSRTVNMASPSMISFIFETISLQDADCWKSHAIAQLFLLLTLVGIC